MKSATLSALIFSTFIVIGCKPNAPEKKDNGLQEVRLDDKASNADIVRLPISNDGKMDTNSMARIQFETSSYNFGTITEGSTIKQVFKFKNVGTVPLVIADIQTSCGCTVPEWQHATIAAGASSEVRVQFNSEGKEGAQEKPIRVIANTFPNETVLMLSGKVNPKK
jgi:Protein of unknown function (DUF1573)